jgi:hypothetical protein
MQHILSDNFQKDGLWNLGLSYIINFNESLSLELIYFSFALFFVIDDY